MSLTNLIRWILLLFYLALSFPLGVFAALVPIPGANLDRGRFVCADPPGY